MCMIAIVDTDSLSILAPRPAIQHKQDAELCDWIRQRHGILAYTNSGKYSCELKHSERIWKIFQEYRRGQQAVLIGESALENARVQLEGIAIRSNDRHLIELALASNAVVLCSNDGRAQEDFINRSVLRDVDHVRRAIYPIAGSVNDRRTFLQNRECPNRTRS